MSKDFTIKTIFKAVDRTSLVIGKMQSKIQKFTARANMGLRKLDRTTSKIARGLTTTLKTGFLGAAAGAGILAAGVSKLMGEFSKVENAEAAFTPLLKSGERAKEMVAALNETAATTPFQFENLAGVANTLLPTMNGNIEETIRFTRMMGDVAGGNVQKMGSISRGFTKAMLKGKADMESMNMIAEAGVPIFDEMAKVMNISKPKLFKAISAGKVKTDDLIKTFETMTGKGGLFFEGMDIASKTLSGRISTLKDNVSLTAAELGSTLAPTLKDLVGKLTVLSQKARKWVTDNKDLIRTKVAEYVKKIPKVLEQIAYWVPKIAKFVGVFYAMTAAIKVANIAMTVFNTLMNVKLGPIKAATKVMGTQMPQAIGKGTGAMTKFHGAIGLVGAAFAGWEIGTIIHEKVIDPIMKAQHSLRELKNEVEDTQKRDLSKRGTEQLKKDIEKVDQTIKAQKKQPTMFKAPTLGMGGASGMAYMHAARREDAQMRDLKRSKERLQSALNDPARRQMENIRRFSVPEDQRMSDIMVPSLAPVQRTETTEKVEIVITDESGGRARVKGGAKARNLNVVHTGGMPQ